MTRLISLFPSTEQVAPQLSWSRLGLVPGLVTPLVLTAHCSHPTLDIPECDEAPVLTPVSPLTSPCALILSRLDWRLEPETPLEASSLTCGQARPRLTHMISPRYRPAAALAQPPLPRY